MGKPKASTENLVVNEQFIEIISKILAFFDGDIKKSRLWLITSNPMFGHIPPLKLIVMGRGDKVLQFILKAEYENQPPEGNLRASEDGPNLVKAPREFALIVQDGILPLLVFNSVKGAEEVVNMIKRSNKPEIIRVKEILP